MAISMKKRRNGKDTLFFIIAFVVAIGLAIGFVALLPVEYQIKKLLFFVLVIVFAILGVLITNVIRRR